MARILVTGAGGFIGRALCPALIARGHRVIAGLRHLPAIMSPALSGAEIRDLGEIVPGPNWGSAFAGIDIVIHLAQRAHRHADAAVLDQEPEAAASLARAAARAGVRRFVYLSSVKAMAEASPAGRPLRPADPPRPADPYGRAKLASEQALAAIGRETGIELVVVRPPLVYGAEAGGNFRALVRLAGSGLPLPFAGLENRRSLIFVGNLVDLLGHAAAGAVATGHVLLAADGDDLSTAALIRLLAAGQGRRARLFSLPGPAFAALRQLPGIGPAAARLTLSLQVDDGPTRALLGWHPPIPGEDALIATARAMIETRRSHR